MHFLEPFMTQTRIVPGFTLGPDPTTWKGTPHSRPFGFQITFPSPLFTAEFEREMQARIDEPEFGLLQDILAFKGFSARINNSILCKHPSVWAPHSPPSSPTLLRYILYLSDSPVLHYI